MMPATVRLSIKPVFVGWITLLILMQLPLQLFFTVWAGDPNATFDRIRQLVDAQNG